MHKTGIEEYYAIKDGKKLRFGYTTGTCAAAAARAAMLYLITGIAPETVKIMTPKGIELDLLVEEPSLEGGYAQCAIRKYSGDDPDVTDGALVYARVCLSEQEGIVIDGGCGVGRVTRLGLQQAIGEAAINKVPRLMIEKEVRSVLEDFDQKLGAEVVISIPKGVELAKRTFNPRLGIEGGISVLGTSGIVEPMSEASLIASIKLEMKQKKELGEELLLVSPGNYGADFIKELCGIEDSAVVQCSNYIGEAIDIAKELGFKKVLFVSHIGKFIKVAGGIMNTHSRVADARMEIMASNAILAGAEASVARKILGCITTDEALEILKKENLLDETMKSVGNKIDFYIKHRCGEGMSIGAVVFSNTTGILCETGPARKYLKEIQGGRL